MRIRGRRAACAVAFVLATAGFACAAPTPDRITQNIIAGSDDDGDPAVVALFVRMETGEPDCTGTLIAPRVVLTAAHCVLPGRSIQAYFGASPGGGAGTFIPVVAQRPHPVRDVALLLLATPSAVTPVPLLPGPLDASFRAQPLRLVGFGMDSVDHPDAMRKRSGLAALGDIGADDFLLQPMPAEPCFGDSGGPAFVTQNGVEYLAGVTSAGDANCRVYGREERVDMLVQDFIRPYVDGIGLGEDLVAGGCAVGGGADAPAGVLALLLLGLLRRRIWIALLALAACAQETGWPVQFTEVQDARVPDARWRSGLFDGCGAAVGDVDGDGRPDVYFVGSGLYLNRPDPAGFRLVPADPGAVDPLPFAAMAASFGDFDRDGDLDLALSGLGGVILLENDGAGHFRDVTTRAGVAGSAMDVSLGVTWGDLNGDGFLDLAVANYGLPFDPHQDAQASRLYLNRRDGTFEELRDPALAAAMTRRSFVAAFLDVNGDGILDFYLTDDAGVDFAVPRERHDAALIATGVDAAGHPQLVESAAALGLADPFRSTMGIAAGDPARLGQFGLFFTDIRVSALEQFDGAAYHDVSGQSGIGGEEGWVNWGGVFADLDGDGYEDLLVAQGSLSGETRSVTLGPMLLRNRGGRFEAAGRYAFGEPMSSRAVVLVDLDGDGDQDAIVAPYHDRFFVMVNETPARNYLRLTLHATVSAPGAAGAVVVVQSGDQKQLRMAVAGGQPYSQSEPVLDFAWPRAQTSDVTVHWPSGAVQRIAAVAAPSSLVIEEPRWITISDARPRADGHSMVTLSLDLARAGLGSASLVRWTSGAQTVSAPVGAAGRAVLTLPPMSAAGAAFGTLSVDDHVVGAHPALDYQP